MKVADDDEGDDDGVNNGYSDRDFCTNVRSFRLCHHGQLCRTMCNDFTHTRDY